MSQFVSVASPILPIITTKTAKYNEMITANFCQKKKFKKMDIALILC